MEPLIGGLLLGGFLAFNAFATPARVQKTAEKALRQQFPGALVHVEVKGKRGTDVVNGRFKSIVVELSNARFDSFPLQPNQTPTATTSTPKKVKTGSIGHLELRLRNLIFADPKSGDLAVSSAVISFDEVRYDFNALKKQSKVRLISFSNGKIALGVESPALLPIFGRRAPDIKNPRVELSGGEAIFSGRREFLGTGTDVIVRGPVVARGRNLELDNPRVQVADLILSPAVAAPFLKGVNPLYEFDPEGKWPLSLRIDRVGAENGALQVEGALLLK